MEAEKAQYLTCMISVGANNEKFGELKDDLSNSYLLGENQYPKNREVLVGLLNNGRGSRINKQQQTRPP